MSLGGGVSRYDGETFFNLNTKDGLVNSDVLVVHQDQDGAMWFGTDSGVSRYDGKKYTNFTSQDGLADSYVAAIHRAPDGVMWFGTADAGVSMYDGVAWTSLDRRDGLAGNTVRTIHQDTDGSLWFGTNEGVTHYRPRRTPPLVHIVSVTTDQTYRDLDAIPTLTTGSRVTFAYNAIDFKTLPEKRQYRVRIYEPTNDRHPPPSFPLREEMGRRPGGETLIHTVLPQKQQVSTGRPRSPAPIPLQCKR